MPRLKGQLRDRVFLRSHLRSSLTPEEGPSCFIIACYETLHSISFNISSSTNVNKVIFRIINVKIETKKNASWD